MKKLKNTFDELILTESETKYYYKGKLKGKLEFIKDLKDNWSYEEDDLPYFEKGDIFIGKDEFIEMEGIINNMVEELE